MTNPVALWHGEHLRFARLLAFLESQMAAFHAGQHPNYELMRDAVYYLHHFADRFHHPREDVAFKRLAARDPTLNLAINRLLQEHRVISAAGEALLKHLQNILDDAVIERATVESTAATYLVYYRHHLTMEEKHILPLAERLLKPDDWAAVVAAVPTGPDPLFGDDIVARYRDLRAQITRDAEENADA